jgi:hypothetical protein
MLAIFEKFLIVEDFLNQRARWQNSFARHALRHFFLPHNPS